MSECHATNDGRQAGQWMARSLTRRSGGSFDELELLMENIGWKIPMRRGQNVDFLHQQEDDF
jgi:hypothetical protein